MLKRAVGIAAILTILLSGSANAANSWYWGEVNRVLTLGSDGSFLIYIDNSTIVENCAHERIVFQVSDMGSERTKAALTMAMTAFVSGKLYGVVVDLPSAGNVCYASATSTQGAGLR